MEVKTDSKFVAIAVGSVFMILLLAAAFGAVGLLFSAMDYAVTAWVDLVSARTTTGDL